ncbi:hypothetical protein [Ralstonia sp. ASV6]|uniref:hypothetical protein n=1 Tax=Ralstonia sp. ASV6 TaxID=2795124 RepID=UPI0018EC8197|nr:hypothetical protein [Ralstonia sp. ASV6]
MFQRTYIAGVTREDIMEALVASGEDPTVSRVDAVRKRLDPFFGPSDYRSAVVKAAVEQVRREIVSETEAGRAAPLPSQPSVANAIAALQLATSHDGAFNVAACKEALAQLCAVRNRVEAFNKGLDDREIAPTGDSYNDLFDLVGVRDEGAVLVVPTAVPSAEMDVARSHPRVLVMVRGGVAETFHDPGVDVEVFDFDNFEADPYGTGKLPAHFADLADVAGAPCEEANLPVRYGVEYEVSSIQPGRPTLQIWHPVSLSHYNAGTPMSPETFVFKARNSSEQFTIQRGDLTLRVRENGRQLSIGDADDAPMPAM